MSQNVNVNLTPGGYPKEFHVSQYDVGRQLVAKVVDSTGDYSIPSGATVVLVGTKPSGFGFTLNGTVSGSTVTFSTTATVTAEYGRIPCEIRITNGSTILGTANCMLVVEMSPHPEGTTDGDGEQIISEITLLLQRITEQADRADQAVTDATAQANRAESEANEAAGSASAAASSESNAAASAATAVGAKNDAVAAKTAAEASEQAAAESAAEARETLETYAKVDGEYDAMTVGTAKALLGDVISESTEPYTFRQTGGGLEVGTIEVVEQIVGGTVAWNQLVQNGNFANTGNWTAEASTYSVNDNIATVVGNSNPSGIYQQLPLIGGHKFLLSVDVKNESNSGTIALRFNGTNVKESTGSTAWATLSTVVTLASSANVYYTIRVGSQTGQARNAQLIDLTAMFGTTIADAIYAMEQATAGAGVAWFKKLFQKDYYPYDAGSLQSSKPSAHVMKDADENVIGNYPLPGIELRGVPKWVDGKLKFDGDIYHPNGVVERRYGYRAYQSGDESLADAITDGSHTVYKLTTPTTESTDPYTAIQICDPDGTEEWVDERTVPIPVGSLTKYTADLVGKLEDLPTIPSAPSANGTYTLKATVSGGTVTYSWVNG